MHNIQRKPQRYVGFTLLVLLLVIIAVWYFNFRSSTTSSSHQVSEITQQSPSESDNDVTQDPTTFSLSGTITDANTGLPLADMQVVAVVNQTWPLTDLEIQVASDSSGYFEITDLESNKFYRIAVTGLNLTTNEVTHVWGFYPYSPARDITRNSFISTMDNLDFALVPAITFSGHVRDAATGEPINNMRIMCRLPDISAVTDANGYYECNGMLASNNYRIVATGRDFATDELIYYPNSSDINGETQTVDFELHRALTISGTVLDLETGQVLDYVHISARGEDASTSTWTDENGSYTLGPLSTGQTYSIVAYRDAGGIRTHERRVYPGQIEAGTTNLEIALERTLSISGTVVDANSGEPVQNVEIEPYSRNAFATLASAYTDENGHYVLEGIPRHSTVRLYAADRDKYAPQYYGGEDHTTAIFMPAGSTNVDFYLQEYPTITGSIRNGLTGEPLRQAQVFVYDITLNHQGMVRTVTDANGDYVVHVRPGQSYYIQFDDRNGQRLFYAGSITVDAYTSAILVPAGSSNIDLVIGSNAGIIGTIIDDQGEPISRARIQLYPLPYVDQYPTGQESQTTFSDEDGNYSFENVQPDEDYYIKFEGYQEEDSTYIEIGQYYPGVSQLSEAWLVQPGTVNVDFSILKPVSIMGTVAQATDGNLLADYEVVLYDENRALKSSTMTDHLGSFEFRELPSGTEYYVEVRNRQVSRPTNNTDYFVAEFYGGGLDFGEATLVAAGSENVNFLLEEGETILGVVTGPDDQLLPYMEIQFYTDTEHLVGTTYTNEYGVYQIQSVRADTSYYIKVTGRTNRSDDGFIYMGTFYGGGNIFDSAILVEAGSREVDITVSRTAEISGRVFDATTGQPIANTRLNLYVGASALADNAIRRISTDEDGYFVFTDYIHSFEDFNHDFHVYATGINLDAEQSYSPRYYNGTWEFSTSSPVLPGSTNLEFALEPSLTISGTVTAMDTSVALPNVEIRASQDNRHQITAVTDSEGKYVITGMLAGQSYRLYAKSLEFNSGYIEEYYGDAYTGNDSPWVEAGSTNIDFVLNRKLPITGQIIDAESGLPLPDMVVTVYAVDSAVPVPVSNVTTSSDGRYITEPLGPWTQYYVRANGINQNEGTTSHAARYYPDTSDVLSAQSVDAGATEVDFALVISSSITGFVINHNTSEPVSDLRIILRNDLGHDLNSATTDDNGMFHFEALSADETYFVYSTGGVVRGSGRSGVRNAYYPQYYPEGDDLSSALAIHPGLDPLEFVLHAPNTIEGNVVDADTGQPLVGMRVVGLGDSTFTDETGHYVLHGSYVAQDFTLQTVYFEGTNEDGIFTHATQYYGNSDTVDLARGIVSGSVNVDFEVHKSSSISGTITETETGFPLIGAILNVINEDGYLVRSVNSVGEGNFRIDGLIAGKSYYIQVIPEGRDLTPVNAVYAHPYFDNVAGIEDATLISAGSEGVNITVSRTVSISGTVIEPESGAGTISAQVHVYDLDGNKVGFTKGAGSYTVNGLEPNTYYYVQAMLDYDGEGISNVNVFYPNQRLIEGATPVLSGSQNVDLQLSRGASISGSVRDGVSGEFLWNANVYIYDSHGVQLRHVMTDEQGLYEVDGLRPEESYFVKCTGFIYPLSSNNDYNLAMEFFEDSITMDDSTPVLAGATNVDFVLEESITIAGVVRYSEGSPDLIYTDTIILFDSAHREIAQRHTTTNLVGHFGEYAFANLRPGYDYYVYASGYSPPGRGFVEDDYDPDAYLHAAEYYPDSFEFETAQPISTDTTDADIYVDRGGIISGTVQEAESEFGLNRMEIFIYNSDGNLVRQTRTSIGGIFHVKALPLDDVYYVLVSGNYLQSQTHIPQFYPGVADMELATTIEPNTTDISFMVERIP